MADLDNLLLRTSRTFALAIPLLPEPLRNEVKLAYLLFRVADTLEDAELWHRSTRLEALDLLIALLKRSPSREEWAVAASQWTAKPASVHDGYQELLGAVPELMEAITALGPVSRDAVNLHALRTAEGMRAFVSRQDEHGNMVLRDVEDLKDYCYVVAGIVGDMLTELFLPRIPPDAMVAARLRRYARAFGEGLQLVNILKDAADDHRHGRVYLPPDVPRSAIMDLARQDLHDAATYIRTLQEAQAPRGVLEFNALSARLAFATVDQVETYGAGAKLSRAEVVRIFGEMGAALDAGQPAM